MTEINESIPQYFSSDLDNNISFYTELLGAEVLYHHRENDRLMWVMVQLGASKLGFEQLDGDRPTPHDLKTVEISFYCDDLEGLWEKLMDANVEPSEIEPTFGMDRFVARDRDGYTLVFWRATILEQPKQSTISAFGH